MRRPHGYSRIEGGAEGLVEEDTVRCQHCQKVGFVQFGSLTVLWPKISPVPLDFFTCKMCYEAICPICANLPCDHFEKKLERIERNAGIVHRHGWLIDDSVRVEQMIEGTNARLAK
jgi:hypothetical protein